MAEFLTSEVLTACRRVRHGFFTRKGGVSQGRYASLNAGLTSGDALDDVLENRRRVAAAMGVPRDHLLTCRQVHSPDIAYVTKPWSEAARPAADAMVTDHAGIALGILTADCVPVLFADETAGVIGAAHAGWRGAISGVLEATVTMMQGLGASPARMVAALGPCIWQDSYEVSPDFPPPFLADDPSALQFFKPAPKPDHHLFDLPGWVAHRLRKIGITQLSLSSADTYSDPGRFYSFRRATHRQEGKVGSLIAVITLLNSQP